MNYHHYVLYTYFIKFTMSHSYVAQAPPPQDISFPPFAPTTQNLIPISTSIKWSILPSSVKPDSIVLFNH